LNTVVGIGMITLAVTTRAETFSRMREPLLNYGIEATYLQADETTHALTTGSMDYSSFDVGFVYPSRLMEGGVIDAVTSLNWVNDRDAILTSRNKAGVIATLAANGIPVPDTTAISNPVDTTTLETVFSAFSSPVVIKPNSGTRGIGITTAPDLDSFLGITDYLDAIHSFPATDDRMFLVQEKLDITTDYRVMLINQNYVGAVERSLPTDTPGRWKHNVHHGGTATGVDLDPEYRSLAEDVASILDIDYLGVDLAVTPTETYVMETNARPTIDTETKYEPGFYSQLASLIKSRVA
jgi:ribosomal protein S6--L-glutamate ligase